MAQQDNPDVQFIGVGGLDSLSAMEGFVAITGVGSFPNINDETGEIWSNYRIGNQPAFVFLAADGSRQTFGSLSREAIQQQIDELF